MSKLTCFKACDIRGRLGEELNVDIAYRIWRAFGQYKKPRQVVVGHDVKLHPRTARGNAQRARAIGADQRHDLVLAAQHAKVRAAFMRISQQFHSSNPNKRAGLSTRIFLSVAASPA